MQPCMFYSAFGINNLKKDTGIGTSEYGVG